MKSRLLVVTMATAMVIAMATLANFGIGLASAQTADNATMTTGNMTGGNMTSGAATEETGGIACTPTPYKTC
jgi:hypothetical protein